MLRYAIIEVDDGLTVVEVGEGQSAEEVAVRYGGVVVDPGPYPTFEEASEALLALPDEDDDAEGP